ncbi:MAG TPA: queuosine precursor transporter [Holophagaceae bacterium]|nr:queuosine precursor transporter [Holophagaceae bacterium]
MSDPAVERAVAKERPLGAYRHLGTLIHIYVVVLLVSNLVGQKVSSLPGFHLFGHQLTPKLSGAQLLFPITYIFGDIFTEVYGYAAARRAIWLAFMASILMAAMGLFMIWIPPSPDWPNQKAFEIVFGAVPRMVAASLAAFWAGEFTNSYVLAKMKVWSDGRHVYSRFIGSTVAGQAVDSIIVNFGFHLGRQPVPTIISLILTGYVAKVLYETVMTPVTYLFVNWLKREEGVDVFDQGTDFNPFASEPARASQHEA